MNLLPLRLVLPCLALLVMSGCAIQPRSAAEQINRLTQERGLPVPGPTLDRRAAAHELLAQPLGVEQAVAVAVLLNPRVQRIYAELDLADADVIAASTLANPVYSFAYLKATGPIGGVLTVNDIAQSISALILRGPRTRLAQAAYESQRRHAADQILALAADTRAAWYRYLSAQQLASLRATMADAANASAELASRFHAAGNLKRLELAASRANDTRAQLHRISADAQADAARRELALMLGVAPGRTDWTISPDWPDQAADLPARSFMLELAQLARLDRAALVKRVTQLEDAAGVTRSTRLLGEAEIGLERESEPFHPRFYGVHGSIEIPVFNRRQGEYRHRLATLEQARAELRMLEAQIAAEVLDAYAHTELAQATLRRIGQVMLPLQQEIVELTQREVNYMLESVFELMAAKQEEYAIQELLLQARRDYWTARSELERALALPLSGLPSDATRISRLDAPSFQHLHGDPADAHPTQSHPVSHSGRTGQHGSRPGQEPGDADRAAATSGVVPARIEPGRTHAQRPQPALGNEGRGERIPPGRRRD